jgi:hypothetical protein
MSQQDKAGVEQFTTSTKVNSWWDAPALPAFALSPLLMGTTGAPQSISPRRVRHFRA